MSAAEALLTRIVDYAGLFPPAALDMETAVRHYQRYLAGDEAWMLGSFVVSASRLNEFTQIFNRVCCEEQENPWTLTVVCAAERADEVRAIEDFQEGALFIASLECKAADARSAQAVLAALPSRARYVEFPPQRSAEILPVLDANSARAKIRTGGLTPETIPTPEAVAQFLLACAREGVPFKATAGLHHPVRGTHALTGDAASPRAMMHGFLNVFLAAALAYFGADEATILRTLCESSAAAFRLDDDVISWHDHELTTEQLEQVRRRFAFGFGSCSFAEPVRELREMRWL
jgi:hypothetical protein